MRQQGETREGEWRWLEQTWHEREARLEKRIKGVEGDYRWLVLTVTSMSPCANAPDCASNAGPLAFLPMGMTSTGLPRSTP